MKERSVSPIIGLVLLIGIVAVASLSIFILSGQMIESHQQQVEQEQVEQSFVELSETIDTTTISGDTPKSITLDAGEQGVITHHDSAKYDIWAEGYDSNPGTHIANGTIGTIEYESDSGSQVAFEGGAVFRETGHQTQIISAPSINYDHETSTLSFPVMTLAEEKTLESGDVNIQNTGTINNNVSTVQEYQVYIEIESDFCQGWEHYFDSQAGDTAIVEECYGSENDEGKLKAKLGYEDIQNAFEAGVAVPDSEDNYSGPAGDSGHETIVLDKADFEPITATIKSLHDSLSDSDGLSTSGTNKAEEYQVTNMTGSYNFDLSDGDTMVAVDEDVKPDEIDVSECANGKHSLKIYAKGDFDFQLSGSSIEPSCSGGSVDTIQFYGTNTSSVNLQSSGGAFHGLVYVASNGDEFNPDQGDYQVEVGGSGNAEIEGSFIAHSLNVQSASNSMSLEGSENSDIDVIPEGHEPAPQLTYLNVAEHEIDIENT